MQFLVIETRANGRPVKPRQLENGNNNYESPCCPKQECPVVAQALQNAQNGGEKRAFLAKVNQCISVRKTCHFQPNLRSSSCTWHPLSLLWDVCQNGPWHLPIVAAQPRMDVAVPAPSPSSGHLAGSGGVTGHLKWHPKHPGAEFAHLDCKKNSL